MRLLGNVDLRTSELPNSLEFTASREDGLIETIAIPLFALIVLWMFWRRGTLWLRIIAGFAAVSTFLALFANWNQGGETRLRVTSDGVRAEGNLGQLFSTSVAVAMDDISSIGFYDRDGEGGISGLYVRHGWRFWPVLPHLSKEQSQAVVDAITKKFPEIPVESALDSSLFADSGKLISLGLSKPSERVTDRRD
jgi:hypothetical protein